MRAGKNIFVKFYAIIMKSNQRIIWESISRKYRASLKDKLMVVIILNTVVYFMPDNVYNFSFTVYSFEKTDQ
ncbi:hypothetical protein Q3H59_004171 [Pantoea sp. SORGH_AS 659]|nr:hypothetical protein [Pantoea sp. SORGH_AS_0659]